MYNLISGVFSSVTMVESLPWLLFLFFDSYIQHFEIKFRMLSINKNLIII